MTSKFKLGQPLSAVVLPDYVAEGAAPWRGGTIWLSLTDKVRQRLHEAA